MSADADWRALRAARANRVLRTDEKRIRTENTVPDKGKNGFLGLLLSKIDDPRGRLPVRASRV